MRENVTIKSSEKNTLKQKGCKQIGHELKRLVTEPRSRMKLLKMKLRSKGVKTIVNRWE